MQHPNFVLSTSLSLQCFFSNGPILSNNTLYSSFQSKSSPYNFHEILPMAFLFLTRAMLMRTVEREIVLLIHAMGFSVPADKFHSYSLAWAEDACQMCYPVGLVLEPCGCAANVLRTTCTPETNKCMESSGENACFMAYLSKASLRIAPPLKLGLTC